MEPIEMLGLVAAILVVISWIPQLAKSIKTKHTADLSWGLIAILLTSQILWVVYGYAIGSLPVLLTNTFTTIFLSILAFLKFRYG
ncbi:MAG: SemiSWEET family transporter [Candidatus Anstonellaceae archaeon]